MSTSPPSGESVEARIRVVSFRCPYAEVDVSELWAGAVPVVAANAYLRSNANWSPETVLAKAKRLQSLFRYLEAAGWDFWDIGVRGGGPRMVMFRNSLLKRARRTRKRRAIGERVNFGYGTARLIMGEVHRLCLFWHQAGESSLYQGLARIEEGRGEFTHRGRVVQETLASFHVKVPADEAPEKHVLLPEDVQRCWAALSETAIPPRPKLLRRFPNGPGAEASEAAARRWATVRQRYARRLAIGRRDLFLWALALSSGMRRQEIPLLTMNDVRDHHGQLWANLKVRPQHAALGRAKTGPRLMYVGFDSRVRDAWQSWMQSRRVLVEGWQQRTGKPDHGMLFVKNDGAPVQGRALPRLLVGLSARVGPVGDDAIIGEGFAIHPHALRHTITEMMRDAGVAEDIIQRHLGHRSRQTTHNYGKAYRARYRAALAALTDATLADATP